VFDYLLHTYDIQHQLRAGKLYLILANIDAYRENQRFLVRDMNRIWSETGAGSEYDRKNILTKYIDACDHILDLHSTSSPSVPMAIDADNALTENTLLSNLDVDYVIRGIMPHMSGETLVAYHQRIHP
jgi:succinylglutamate desuccinylase